MRTRRMLGFGTALGLLAAMPLASTGESAAARSCAASVAELTSTSLQGLVEDKKKKGKFSFSPKSSCLVREEHPPLPALLLDLPEFPGPYVLRVESLIGKSLVMPRLEFYDQDGALLRTVDRSAFRTRTTVVSADVFMRTEHAAARRVLILPDPAELGKSQQRTSLETRGAYVPYAMWFSGAESTVNLNQVEVGTLVVALLGEPWEKKSR